MRIIERTPDPIKIGDERVINGEIYQVIGIREESFDSSYGEIAHNEGEVPSWVESRKAPKGHRLEKEVFGEECNGYGILRIVVLKKKERR